MRDFYTNNTSANQNLGLTWSTNWIGWFESPWGIIEKIKYANLMSSRDFMDLFGSEQVQKNKKTLNITNKCLMTLRGINEELLQNLLGFSLNDTNSQMIKKLCGPLFDGDQITEFYFHESLMICPKCIEDGFHSTLHQFKLIESCPFHKVNLIKASENCLSNSCKEISYEITGDKKINPFGCSCGANWLGDVNPYSPTWYQPKIEDIQIDSIRDWISLKPNEVAITKKIFYLKKEKDQNFKGNFINRILQIKMGNEKNYKTHTISSGKNIDKLKTINTPNLRPIINDDFFCSFPLQNNNLYHEHYDHIYQSSTKIINSISRMIRKRVFSHHKNCVIRMKNSLKETAHCIEPFCPIAFSYLEWRYAIQGFRSFKKVDNFNFPITRDKDKEGFDLPFYTDKDWLLDFIISFKEQVTFSTPNNINGLTWVINHILSDLAINHFNKILEYIIDYRKKNDTFFNYSNHLYNRFDPLLIKLPMNVGEPYEYHFINKSRLIDFNSYNSLCKYQSHGKYKLKKSEKKFDHIKILIDMVDAY